MPSWLYPRYADGCGPRPVADRDELTIFACTIRQGEEILNVTEAEPDTAQDHRMPLPFWTVLVRIASMIGVLAGALLLALALTNSSDPTAHGALWTRILGGLAITALVIVVIMALVSWSGRRSLSVAGSTTVAGDLRAFGLGIAAWSVPAAATFLVLALLGSPLQITAPAADFWLVLVLLFFAVLLSEAIPEELAFRGYVSSVLAERLSSWWVIGVQTALFVATAVLLRGGANPLDVSLFAAMGFVLGNVRLVAGSVWAAVGIHVAFQTASQLVFTHSVIKFDGSQALAMLALGGVPFTVAAILCSVPGVWKTHN